MKNNKKHLCREALIQRILTMDIEPGSILDETQLSQQYELSRTPLREVFQQLAGEGYLTLAQNRGAKVSSMDLSAMRNFFQVAGMMYAAISRLAAENANPVLIERLKSIQAKLRKSLIDEPAANTALLNHEFHACIGELADNPYLVPSYNRLLIDHTRIGQRFYSPTNPSEQSIVAKACHHHDELIDAIERRAPADAVRITLEHWELSKSSIERFVQPDPLSHDIGDQNLVGDRHAI